MSIQLPSSSNDISKLSLQLESYIQEMFKNETITTSNILIVISDIMQIVEKYNGLNGLDKKNIVLNLITSQLNSSNKLSLEEKTSLLLIVSTIAPTFIDTIISATNGKFNLNKNYFCCC